MKRTTRQFVTCTLLILYGGITLLDQGLHSLLPGGGHHQGLEIVERVSIGGHADCHSGHCLAPATRHVADSDANQMGATLQSNGYEEHSHLCAVCAYLVQARSDQIQFYAAADCRPVATVAVAVDEPDQPQAVLGPYAPRGPPRLAA